MPRVLDQEIALAVHRLEALTPDRVELQIACIVVQVKKGHAPVASLVRYMRHAGKNDVEVLACLRDLENSYVAA